MKKATRKFAERLPDVLIAEMHADYLETKSLWTTGEKYNRTAATLHKLFKNRGLFVQARTYPVLTDEQVAVLYADYQSGLSLDQVAKKHGKKRQSLFEIFKSRGLKLRARNLQQIVEYKGRRFTCQKTSGRHRYLRDTIRRGKTLYLHHVVWEEHNGPIPAGHKVCFKDGNHLNCAIENLELLSNSEQVRKHATGANQFTKIAKPRLEMMLKNKGGKSLSAQLIRRAA